MHVHALNRRPLVQCNSAFLDIYEDLVQDSLLEEPSTAIFTSTVLNMQLPRIKFVGQTGHDKDKVVH